MSSTFDTFTRRVVVGNDPMFGAWILLVLGVVTSVAALSSTDLLSRIEERGPLDGYFPAGSWKDRLLA